MLLSANFKINFIFYLNIQERQMTFLHFANLIEQPMMNLLHLRLLGKLNVILYWYIRRYSSYVAI